MPSKATHLGAEMKFILIVVMGLFILAERPAWEIVNNEQVEGAPQINLAGRQRMLSQRMAIECCFMKGWRDVLHTKTPETPKRKF